MFSKFSSVVKNTFKCFCCSDISAIPVFICLTNASKWSIMCDIRLLFTSFVVIMCDIRLLFTPFVVIMSDIRLLFTPFVVICSRCFDYSETASQFCHWQSEYYKPAKQKEGHYRNLCVTIVIKTLMLVGICWLLIV